MVEHEGRATVSGYCAATGWGAGNCSSELMGSWPIGPHLRSMGHCIARCRKCLNCAYVSFSVAPLHAECSWYARCDLVDLRPSPSTGGYSTLQVKTPRQQRRVKSVALHHHGTRRVAILAIAIGSSVRCGLIQ